MQANQAIQAFDSDRDYVTLSIAWPKWKRSLELYLKTQKITSPEEKKNMLLHCAGADVQELYDTLYVAPEVDESDEDNEVNPYEEAIEILDRYFIRKINFDLEKSKFRRISQEQNESIDKFIYRLRKQGQRCGFGEQLDENIREQIIEKGSSKKLQRQILSKDNMNLQEIVEAAHALELTKSDDIQNELEHRSKNEMFAIERPFKPTSSLTTRACFRCGRTGHFSRDSHCPARRKKCNKCNRIGHFQAVCRSDGNFNRHNTSYPKDRPAKYRKKIKLIDGRHIDEPDDQYDNAEVFAIRGNELGNRIWVEIGGVKTEVVIDSGAQANVMDRDTWELMKERKIKTLSRVKGSSMELKGFGAVKPLEIVGEFVAEVRGHLKSSDAKFYVVAEKGCTLLGQKTSLQLEVLKIGYDINKV